MFLQQKYIAKYLFFKCIYDYFLYICEKQEKCIILMYYLYESINKHNADIDFFVHALAMF